MVRKYISNFQLLLKFINISCVLLLTRTLYQENLLPKRVHIVGYARSDLTVDHLRKNADPHVDNEKDEKKYDKFWHEVNRYIRGGYDTDEDYKKLDAQINEWEKTATKANRLYYMALPSTVYQQAIAPLKANAMSKK